jgi:hypothetical protein
MASTEFSLEVVKESLSKEGFFYWEDLAVGEGILEMEKRGFEYFSEYGPLKYDLRTKFALVERDCRSLGYAKPEQKPKWPLPTLTMG